MRAVDIEINGRRDVRGAETRLRLSDFLRDDAMGHGVAMGEWR